MSAMTRALSIVEMQARELVRRRAAMALFALLPAAFFYSIPPEEEYAVVAGAIGVSWAVAAAGMFSILGWRRVDPRLGILGARPREGMLGRLAVSQSLAVVLVVVYAPLILARSTVVAEAGTFVLALALIGVVSVPMGLLIGALVPRELEGTLVLIGVIGVESSIPPGTSAAVVLPLYGPLEALQVAGGMSEQVSTGAVIHTVAPMVAMTALAYWLWRRRIRVADGT